MSISDKILDAIELLTKKSVEKAGYDRTIEAQIISCEDATIGKYRCRYQDAIIQAYAGSSDVTFNKGAYVYILVPENDMRKDKTILGTTDKLGINYISQAQGDQAYNIIGSNNIISDNNFYLDTLNKNYIYTLYLYNRVKNDIVLDITALQQYIKQSSSLIVGASFKTSIPIERQSRGHYGIVFNLTFLDNASGQQVTRSYIVDEDNMVDNPYRLFQKTRQYQIFDIDGVNFVRIDSIQIFNKNFPNATGNITEEKLNTGDIEIFNLELFGAERMTEQEINGVSISFYTPQGLFFTESATTGEYKTITAQVRIKGKLVSNSQNLDFYWGSENVGISPDSEYYNKYLGRGWQCLNDSNIITDDEEGVIVEWVPHSDTYILNFDAATAKNNKIKVAVLYDGNVITKEISIQNLAINVPNLSIQSDSGTKFYFDIGKPTLTCLVDGVERSDYIYYWAYESNAGILQDLPETTEVNDQYDAAVASLSSIEAAIAAGTKFTNAEAETLEALRAEIKNYDFIQRVKGNKVYNAQIRYITNFGIFKCSVYNGNRYLGTTSIRLFNSLRSQDNYSLVINNGAVTFEYDENGIAPNNRSLDVPQQIQGLSFTIYDNLGNPIDEDVARKNCTVRWSFPIKDTLLVDGNEEGTDSGIDETETYKYYDNVYNLIYNIAQRYDIKKQRNQIKLTVDYKGMSLSAETSFTFAKQGEPGTNGTQYLVKLVPNTLMENPPLWPMITRTGNTYKLNYGYGSYDDETDIGLNIGYQFFKAQLWHSGELVWEGVRASDPALDGITKPDNNGVVWSILANKYNVSASDVSAFEIQDARNGQIAYIGDNLNVNIGTPYADIIKCSITWEGKVYTGTIPIITAYTVSEDYRVGLRDYTGFRYVMYSTDGLSPKYDNSHPFEFVCMQKIDNIWEDISNVSGFHMIEYVPGACGNTRNLKDSSIINAQLLTVLNNNQYREGLANNQWRYRPASKYNGECVNAAVTCVYMQNQSVVGRINIPIHFLLNKYGLSNINAWDGNSIQINEEGGYILSPQMGAGVKNDDNTFTGVLMGEVKTPDKNTSDIGLMGYNDGDRTFFLNSENGAALFGKKGNGQIALDPSAEKALLYSDNFWQNYDENTGLPSSYSSYNEAGQGLLIDLTKPEIRFGNGNFKVDDDGVYIRGDFVLENGTTVQQAIDGIQGVADDAIISDTLHYLATSYGSEVTRADGAWGTWSTTPQSVTSTNKYLWTYHTYMKGNGELSYSTPVITGVYGDQGPSGESGEDAIQVVITSNVGNMFLNVYTEATLTCSVYKGLEDITSEVTQFNWIKKDKNGNIDPNWSKPSQQSIDIDSNDIDAKAIFVCEVEF